MKLWTKITRIASAVFTALWIVLICASIVEKQNYSDPGAEALDIYLSKRIYNVFIAAGITGLISTGILTLCIYTFSGHGQSRTDAIMWTSYFFSIIANCVFYLFWYGIFYQGLDITLLHPITWIISLLVCFGLLTNRWIEKLVQKLCVRKH